MVVTPEGIVISDSLSQLSNAYSGMVFVPLSNETERRSYESKKLYVMCGSLL